MQSNRIFWKRAPKEPGKDWLMYSLLIPIALSVFGFFLIGIFSFSFSSIEVIPIEVRNWLMIFGSALVVGGSESNSPATFILVFRRWIKKEEHVNVWDWSALVTSGLGSVLNLLIVFSLAIMQSQNFSGEATWLGVVLDYGPLFVCVAVACDFYGSLIELGFLYGDYENRMETWLQEKFDFEHGVSEEEHALSYEVQALSETVTDLSNRFDYVSETVNGVSEKVDSLSWPVITKAEFFGYVSNSNGRSAELAAMGDQAVQHVAGELQRNVPTSRTVDRWIAELT